MSDAFIIGACRTPRGIGKSVKRRWLIFTYKTSGYNDGDYKCGLTYMQFNAVNDEVIEIADKISSLHIFI